MVVFSSYVSLPEGIFPVHSHVGQFSNHIFPIVSSLDPLQDSGVMERSDWNKIPMAW